MAVADRTGVGPTIYSVADSAGVSIATVSRVLHGSTAVSPRTRDKVLSAVDRLDYVPSGAARSLAARQFEAHGLVLPELRGPYYSELLLGFEARAAELEQSVVVVLADGNRDLGRALRRLAIRVDGIAMLGSIAEDPSAARTLHGVKPVVVIAGDTDSGVDTISAENARSAHDLTQHLFDHGRSDLLFVGDPDVAPDVRLRLEGFRTAHRERGRSAADPVRIRFRESDGVTFADQLMAGRHHADGLVCANDELALSIMSSLGERGVDVPADLSVVGWDDVMTARYVSPGLTTVRQPVHEMGALAAERLHARVTGAGLGSSPVLPTDIVIRGSCGCTTPATAQRKSRPRSSRK